MNIISRECFLKLSLTSLLFMHKSCFREHSISKSTVLTNKQWSFRGGTCGNAVPIVKIPLERMGTAFPLLAMARTHIYFLKCILLSKRCFLDPKIWQNALAAGALPQTPLGELTTLPSPLVGWEGDISSAGKGTPLPRPHPAQRLRRFDSRAFGTRYSAPSAPRISRLRRSILAFPLLLIYEMTTANKLAYCRIY